MTYETMCGRKSESIRMWSPDKLYLVCALSVLTATFNVECITCIFFSFIESTSVIIIVYFSIDMFVKIFFCLNTHFLTLKMCLVLSV